MINDLAYRRLRLAELEHCGETETVVQHGRCRSVIRGTDAERLKLRKFINDLHNGLERSHRERGEVRSF